MRDRTSSVTKSVLVALLVGIAAIGCAGNKDAGNGSQATFAPTGQTAQATQTTQTDQAQATETPPAVTESTAPDASGNPDVAVPQIDAQLNAIDQALSNLDSSLSGADAGPSAGE
ncbi:MAG TPA: hypothetical protein VF337_01640 [Candidatus Limnocylindrales bacterium]